MFSSEGRFLFSGVCYTCYTNPQDTQMASLYPRKNSPYWWIRFKDPSGKWQSKPTPYRRDNPQQTKIARARCAANTAEELSATGVTNSNW